MRKIIHLLGFVALFFSDSQILFARNKRLESPLIQLGGGVFDVLRHNRCGQAQIDYKWRPFVYQLRPFVSFMATEKGTAYFCGGLGYDIFLYRHFVITPSFAPGLYFQGKGKNLGYPLEFRSSIEGAFVFRDNHRLGVQFYHLSNASMGSKNPGEESLIFFLAIPLKY